MRSLSGKEVCRILMLNGFEQVRQRGSHIVMQKKVENTTMTVIVPNHKELKLNTLRSIIRQSKLNKGDFE